MPQNFTQLEKTLKEVTSEPGFDYTHLTHNDQVQLNEYATEYFSLLIVKFISDRGPRNNDNKFYGGLLSLCTKEIDWTLTAPAACYYHRNNFTVVINPTRLLKYTLEEIYAILRHECYHILNNHLTRMMKIKNINHKMFNYAADCCINQYIQGLPENVITLAAFKDIVSKLTDTNPNDIEAEQTLEYYCEFLENSKLNIEELTIDEEGNIYDSQGNNIGKIKPIDDHSVFEKSDKDPANMAEARIKKMIEQARVMNQGTLPAGVQEILDRMDAKPEITWLDLMKRYRGQVLYGDKPTPVRLNRRQPSRRDLKGTLKDRLTQIVAVIDTSGSMSDQQLAYCMEQIFSIYKQVPHEVTIIQADMEIQEVYTAKKAKDVKLEVKGRGGTLFTPAIEYINSHPKYQRSIVVYFTDGYGEGSIPKPKCQYLLWVITNPTIGGDSYATIFGARNSSSQNTSTVDPRTILSVENPYGEVKLLKGVTGQ